MENLIQILSSVGFTEKEAKVYIALLQLGRASSYSISSRSGLKKPTTYVILDELIKKGLATKIPRAKKQQYIATPPEEFFANAEEKLKQAKKALPELITMSENEKIKVQTLFYEGVKGIEDALSYHVKEMGGKEIVGLFATAEDAPNDLLNVYKSWGDKLNKAGVLIRGITPEHESTKEINEYQAKQFSFKVKRIPISDYSSKVSLEAGDDFVRIILNKPQQALIIRNPEFAKCIKEIFEIVYSSK